MNVSHVGCRFRLRRRTAVDERKEVKVVGRLAECGGVEGVLGGVFQGLQEIEPKSVGAGGWGEGKKEGLGVWVGVDAGERGAVKVGTDQSEQQDY